jgi:lipase chaperone LimK
MGTRAQIEQLVAQATAKAPDANVRIDALEKAGPPVLVALMIIADAIDVLRQQVDAMGQTKGSDDSNDLTAQLSTLTSQLTKLTKTAKKITKEKKTKKFKKKNRNKNNK